MIKSKYILWTLSFIFACMMGYSCKDEQDDHYERSGSLSNTNLYELIKQNEDLSKFTKLVEIAKYDTLLSSTQTFTVWAPINEALSDINLATITQDQARLIVNNHIARFNNSTSYPVGKLIRMKNYKIYTFSDGGAIFGGAKLILKDNIAKNGLLHIIENQIPYRYNLYEYIVATPDLSDFSTFIRSFEEERFDEDLSIPIDIDNNGRTVYDTVTTFYNRLFDDPGFGLGYINKEDSLYTMLMPSNQAWNDAYAKIAPFFKRSNNDPKADSIQKIQTKLAILSNLIYRGVINNPASRDSLVSTGFIKYGYYDQMGGGIIYDPGDLFAKSMKVESSNGLVYQTDDLRYNNVETWNPYLYVESDLSSGRVVGPNTVVNTREVAPGSLISITDLRYIEVQPTNSTAQSAVTFDIPNVLAGKYDIYVEFIPGIIDGTPKDSTKLLFDLQYMNVSGVVTSKTVNTANLVTSGTKKVKMKVFSEFEFPISNYYDRLWWMDYYSGLHTINDHIVTTKLMIKTNVSATENIKIFTRKFRVDRIIFESVHK